MVGDSIPYGDSEFFFCPTLVTRRKTSFYISLLSLKLTIIPFTNMTLSTFLSCQHYAERVSCELRNRPHFPQSLWRNSRALERGIRRTETRSLMGTQKFPLSHARVKTKDIFLYLFPQETIIFSRLFKSIILLTLIGMLFYEKNQGHERRTSNPTFENTYNIWVLLQCKKMLNHD